jgi:serine beta-lactamase-like protein LACTB, mitochondrial
VVLALVFAIAIVIVGGAALYFVATINPVHTDPAAVPSTAVAAPAERYSTAVEAARRLARDLLVQENLPGLSVAVSRNGDIVWAEGFGFADVKRHEPMTPRTRFRLGSDSKTLTTAGVLLLHDRGCMDLDAPIQTYVSTYPKKEWPVTARHLMGDMAGVYRVRGDNNDQVAHFDCASIDEAVKFFADEPLLFEPGTEYRLGTNGWILLSAAVEASSGKPFLTFMTNELFKPLRMDSTMLETKADVPDLTSFYFPRVGQSGTLGLEQVGRTPNECLFGAGGFLSTPTDMARFGAAMLTPGLLKAESIALLQAPVHLQSGAATDFAFGWKVETVQLKGASTKMVAHRAKPLGGTSAILLFPEQRLVVAVASNLAESESVAPFTLKLAEAFAE